MFSHLKDNNISFIKHFTFAIGAGMVLILAGIASVVHAIFPDILVGYSEKKTIALARLAKQRRKK